MDGQPQRAERWEGSGCSSLRSETVGMGGMFFKNKRKRKKKEMGRKKKSG